MNRAVVLPMQAENTMKIFWRQSGRSKEKNRQKVTAGNNQKVIF